MKKQRGRETNGGTYTCTGRREGRREGGVGGRGRREGGEGRERERGEEGRGGGREREGGEERMGRSNTLLTIEEGCSGLRVGGYTLQQCKGIAHSV